MKFYAALLITAFVSGGLTTGVGCHSITSYVPKPLAAMAESDTIKLGRQLFFDPILSSDRSVSCASCHRPDHAFSDTSAFSFGVRHQSGSRNTPSAMNVTEQLNFFWDGRAKTLEDQALMPIANPNEMDLPVDSALARLQLDKHYQTAFRQFFGGIPDRKSLAAAIAAFERTLETSNTDFDDWRLNNNEQALSQSAKNGYALFNSKAGCIRCHFGTNFNNAEFRNIGLFDGVNLRDSGRSVITKNPSDLGKFKIAPLRNIACTAPYMHNGMFKTLREVIDYYNDPDKIVTRPVNRDSLLNKPLGLTEQEKHDLEAFLRSLTDKRFTSVKQ